MNSDQASSDQASFAEALLDPERRVPDGVTSHTHPAPAKRFAVYRNNVVVSLIDALATRFPAVQRIVGEEFFRAMAGVFVRAHPPRSPLMMTYGEGLPAFIETFAPAAELPYLADVARLEAARTRAFHAADATALPAEAFSALDPTDLETLRIRFSPGTAIVRSSHPIVTIWAMNADEAEPAPIEDWCGEDALISREGFDVVVRRLPPGGAVFLSRLLADATLANAAYAAMQDSAAFDLAENIAGLISAHLATELVRTQSPAP
ncbi:MAG: DNA-binding domain-containing protein [Rhodoplanes sp.]